MVGQGHLNHLVDVIILRQIGVLQSLGVMRLCFANGKIA
jgi:hypothetical protein